MKRRRLPRILLNAATAVSLALCVAAVPMWVRSYYRFDRVEWVTGRGQMYAAESEAGAVYVPLYDAGSKWDTWDLSVSSSRSGEGWHNGRAARAGVTVFRSGISSVLTVSYWLLTTVTLIPGAVVWGTARVARRRRNYCGHCGYDLRATPDRCPECGHVPPSAPPAT